MKKEATKKSKLWLWLVLGAVALLAAVGVALALSLGGSEKEGQPGGRPELYWNLDKAFYTENSDSGLSSREPGEDGMYHIRFAYEGQVQEYAVADKQLVNFIDTLDCVHLVFDNSGNVVDAMDVRDVATEVGKKVYVRYYRNDTLYVNTSIAMNGMTLMLDITDVTRIYDVNPNAEDPGAEIAVEDLEPMDCVTIYANDLEQNTHIYLEEKPEESPVYWRVKANYGGSDVGTARIPDSDGAYSIDFFCDGEIVTLKCKDKSIVDYIDYKSDYKAHFGFVFDEEGYIVKRIASEIGIQGRCIGEGYDVTYIDDVEIELTSTVWSNAGDVEGFKLEDDTVIYDVSKAAFAEGRQGKQVDSLQEGDRVVVWLDTENDAKLVYVTERLVDSPAYYNVERKYSSSKKESTRTPNADGWYEVELAVNGEVKTFKTKDKAKIDYLDSFSPRALGLKVINGNEIEYVYHANCVFGYKYFCDGRFVTSANSGLAQLWSRTQDKTYNCVLDPELKVYDMSGVGELGSETTLQVGDNVLAYQKPTGELICVYVMQRTCKDANLYWNLSRKYDATKKETTRVPDENGWYIFEMAMGGKTVTVKTQSKAMATKIDAFSPAAMGLIVDRNGVVQSAFHPKNVYGGSYLTSGTYVSKLGSGTVQTYSLKTGKYLDIPLAADCKIYNVSSLYLKEKGETTTLKMGDMITVYPNINKEAAVIFVRTREADNMYWKQDRFYDSTNKVTTRVPDAEGWYVFNLAVNGEVKTFKTKDVEVASKVDATESGFTLLLNGDEILRYASASYTKDVTDDGVINWDVVSVDGRKVTLKYNRPGSDNTGKTKTITLASNVKIMDVSPTAEKFGAYTKLQPGDRIRSYVNKDDDHLYVWVKYRNTREKGAESYCDHCGQNVYWNPYMGGSISAGNGHYYLVEDAVVKSQTTVGNDTLDYEVVIDLNGKVLTRDNGRALLVYKGEKLFLMDSVGGGEVRATGSSAGNGGVLMVSGGAEFTLMSGTLRAVKGETTAAYGGIVAVSGTGSVFNMNGGKLADGVTAATEEKSPLGGSIYCSKGTVNISGGVIENGSAKRGGNIYMAANAAVNISGGTVSGGAATDYAGNIYVSTNAVLTVSGGAVSGGSAKYGGNISVDGGAIYLTGGELTGGAADLYGGNIYARGKSLNISGGKISGGTAGDYAGNIYFTTSSTCDLNLTGGEIAGDVRLNGAGKVTVSGTPKIGVGSEGGLDIRNGVLLELEKMETGAEIYMSVSGVFTKPCEDPGAYQSYFKTAKQGGTIYVASNGLAASDSQVKFEYCEHCASVVLWTAWHYEDATELVKLTKNDHFYLTDDVTMTQQTNVNSADADVVLDLAGHRFAAANGKRALSVYGKLTLMDSVGGGVVEGSSTANGATIFVPGGSVEVYGVTVSASNRTSGLGGCVYVSGEGSIFMDGTVVTGGSTEKDGGDIYIANGALTLKNAVIKDGVAASGSGIYLEKGSMELTDTSVSGSTVVQAGSVSVSGAVKLEDIQLNSVKLNLGEMLDGTQIGITADGAFTEANEHAKTYLENGWIFSVPEKQIIFEQDGILYAENIPADAAQRECAHCGELVWWYPWEKTNKPASGHYILTEAVDMERTRVNIGSSSNRDADIVLDLNGFSWTTGNNRAFWVYGNLSIMDSVGSGEIVANGSNMGSGGVMRVDGKLTLYSGVLRRNVSDSLVGRGGVLQLTSGAEFVMKDGKLTGGVCVEYTDEDGEVIKAHGGSIYADGATVRIEGGIIENGTAAVGGNLYFKNTQLFVAGGRITGGSVYLENCTADLTDADVDDAVEVTGEGSFTVNGATKLSNLCLTTVKLTLGSLQDGAVIGITASGAFTETNENARSYMDAGWIISVPVDQVITHSDGVLYAETAPQGGVKRQCAHCGELVWWTPWENTNKPASGHYYLTGAVNMERTRVNIGSSSDRDADVVLDLNGQKCTTGDNRAFWVYGNFSVMDSVGGGEIVANGSNMGSGGVMRVDGKLTLYSGVLRRNVSDSLVGRGGVLQLTSGAEFVMKDGKLTGGVCVEYTDEDGEVIKAHGGSIYADGATVRIEGGIVENGEAASGGNLYLADSALVMTGGILTGGVATTSSGGNLYLLRSSFVLDDGTIENGIAGNRGGNILLETESSFTMNGGLIQGGQAAKQGGNIRLNYAATEITVTGGTIMGDMTVFSAKKFTLSGSPKILMGNSAGLILGDGIDSSAGNASLKLTLDNLNTDAEIYISAVGDITDAPAAEYIGCFKGALRTAVSVDAETGVLKAEQGSTGFCPHCWKSGEPAAWTDAATITSASSGTYTKLGEDAHYYLTGNISRSGNGSRLNIGGTSATGVDIVIDLNGYNWTVTNNRVAQVFAQLTVMDSLCKGVMSGQTKGADPYSSVITVNHNNASLTLYSGTLKGTVADAAAVNCNKGVFRHIGGYVLNAEAATVDTVVLGANATLERTGGVVDGEPLKKKEENA